jgi:hypothetical protein
VPLFFAWYIARSASRINVSANASKSVFIAMPMLAVTKTS